VIGASWATGSWADSWVNGSWGAVVESPPPVITGSGRRNRKGEWWKDYQKQVTTEAKRYDDMKAQVLAAQLAEVQKEKDRILREQSAIRRKNEELTEALGNMKAQAMAEAAPWIGLVNQVNTVTAPKVVDPRREQAIANLEKAREAREAAKKAEEEKRKKQLKNLAKARKAKGK
jgi:hypothetical protein